MTFVPVRIIIEDVTNEANAVVLSNTPHGYETGQVVRIIVPPAYGMNLYEQTKIVVIDYKTFTTDIDTTSQLPFVTPPYVPGSAPFTFAQCIPITGVEENIL